MGLRLFHLLAFHFLPLRTPVLIERQQFYRLLVSTALLLCFALKITNPLKILSPFYFLLGQQYKIYLVQMRSLELILLLQGFCVISQTPLYLRMVLTSLYTPQGRQHYNLFHFRSFSSLWCRLFYF
jgi:hypothetical protein